MLSFAGKLGFESFTVFWDSISFSTGWSGPGSCYLPVTHFTLFDQHQAGFMCFMFLCVLCVLCDYRLKINSWPFSEYISDIQIAWWPLWQSCIRYVLNFYHRWQNIVGEQEVNFAKNGTKSVKISFWVFPISEWLCLILHKTHVVYKRLLH